MSSEFVSLGELAGRLGITKPTLCRWVASGRAPRPIKCGHWVHWLKDEIDAWIQAKMPPADEWESRREAAGSR